VVTHKAHVDDIATGILAIFSGHSVVSRYQFYTVYISLSLALNVILTSMIVVRLILYSRNVRVGMGSSARIGGLYKSIATMLVESAALFTVSSVLAIGLWAAPTAAVTAANVFVRILAVTQVRTFFYSILGRFVSCDNGTGRSSLHCSLFNESQTRAHLRVIPLSTEAPPR